MVEEEAEDDPTGQKEELERIIDSPYWTQSIAPGKYYKRVWKFHLNIQNILILQFPIMECNK